MWTRLTTTLALCLATATAQAQPANDSTSKLESCIQVARLADTICSKIANDTAQRVECFAKGRAAQLECLDRVLSEVPGQPASPASPQETASPAKPAETAPPKATAETPAASETGRSGQPAVSVGSNAADEAAKLSNAAPKPAPAAPPVANLPPPEAAAPTAAIQSGETTGRTTQPDVSVGSNPADETAKLSDAVSNPAPASVRPTEAEAPTGAIRSTSAEETRIDKPAAKADWLLSETMSPVDYSPLVTAVVHATSDVKDGPETLAVRCRSQRTELSIRTNRAWSVPRGKDLAVDYQINDSPVVRQPWSLSPDGKTATYKADSAELVRSIPDGATLKIGVADKGNVRLEATFELEGLSAIRQKVGAACKWASMTARTSSEKP